jgi:hypothetical protein
MGVEKNEIIMRDIGMEPLQAARTSVTTTYGYLGYPGTSDSIPQSNDIEEARKRRRRCTLLVLRGVDDAADKDAV